LHFPALPGQLHLVRTPQRTGAARFVHGPRPQLRRVELGRLLDLSIGDLHCRRHPDYVLITTSALGPPGLSANLWRPCGLPASSHSAGRTPTARHSTFTCAAPAFNKTRAASSTVAPDVYTSSTKSSRRPARRAARHGRNAPRTLAWRSRADSFVCVSVLRTRRSASAHTGRPTHSPTTRARTSAWLNPRSSSRDGCNGTGTSASTGHNTGSRSRQRPSSTPSAIPSSRSPPYLKRWM